MDKHRTIRLNREERARLEQIMHAHNEPAQTKPQTKRRAHILLWSDRGQGQARTDQAVAAVGCNAGTVRAVRQRYPEEGLAAPLIDIPRPGAAPTITAKIEARLVVLPRSAPTNGQRRWTLRRLAERLIELGQADYVSHVKLRRGVSAES